MECRLNVASELARRKPESGGRLLKPAAGGVPKVRRTTHKTADVFGHLLLSSDPGTSQRVETRKIVPCFQKNLETPPAVAGASAREAIPRRGFGAFRGRP